MKHELKPIVSTCLVWRCDISRFYKDFGYSRNQQWWLINTAHFIYIIGTLITPPQPSPQAESSAVLGSHCVARVPRVEANGVGFPHERLRGRVHFGARVGSRFPYYQIPQNRNSVFMPIMLT